MTQTSQKTPLYAMHKRHNALMVDFAGWSMPLHYGSQLAEHLQVRADAGIFDVSHMGIIDVGGADSAAYLAKILANNIGKLKQPGKALYSCMLNENGGILDDLIVYYLEEQSYRLVVNAATTASDYHWLQQHSNGYQLNLQLRKDLSMLAVQGPNAKQRVAKFLATDTDFTAAEIINLKPFNFIKHGEILIAGTGYTGEDGVEIILPAVQVVALWQALLALNIAPIGLGARDTLRLEAGFCLYGQDMDVTVTPLESNLAWTVAWHPEDREFIGREALALQRAAGVKRELVGLKLEGKGVLRSGYQLYAQQPGQQLEHHDQLDRSQQPVGQITSGSYSPTLQIAIALARIQVPLADEYLVDIRGKRIPVKVVKPGFLSKAKVL